MLIVSQFNVSNTQEKQLALWKNGNKKPFSKVEFTNILNYFSTATNGRHATWQQSVLFMEGY